MVRIWTSALRCDSLLMTIFLQLPGSRSSADPGPGTYQVPVSEKCGSRYDRVRIAHSSVPWLCVNPCLTRTWNFTLGCGSNWIGFLCHHMVSWSGLPRSISEKNTTKRFQLTEEIRDHTASRRVSFGALCCQLLQRLQCRYSELVRGRNSLAATG